MVGGWEWDFWTINFNPGKFNFNPGRYLLVWEKVGCGTGVLLQEAISPYYHDMFLPFRIGHDSFFRIQAARIKQLVTVATIIQDPKIQPSTCRKLSSLICFQQTSTWLSWNSTRGQHECLKYHYWMYFGLQLTSWLASCSGGLSVPMAWLFWAYNLQD